MISARASFLIGRVLTARVGGELWPKGWVLEPTSGRDIASVWLAAASGFTDSHFPAGTQLSDRQIVHAIALLIVAGATDSEIIELAAAGRTPIILAAVKREIERRAIAPTLPMATARCTTQACCVSMLYPASSSRPLTLWCRWATLWAGSTKSSSQTAATAIARRPSPFALPQKLAPKMTQGASHSIRAGSTNRKSPRAPLFGPLGAKSDELIRKK